MNKFVIGLLTMTVTGCVSVVQRAPMDVSMIPNDCANRASIIRWLEQNAQVPQQNGETKEDYERSRAQIRSRIWNMRYTCQPV
jgi:hypothetical protein